MTFTTELHDFDIIEELTPTWTIFVQPDPLSPKGNQTIVLSEKSSGSDRLLHDEFLHLRHLIRISPFSLFSAFEVCVVCSTTSLVTARWRSNMLVVLLLYLKANMPGSTKYDFSSFHQINFWMKLVKRFWKWCLGDTLMNSFALANAIWWI